MYRGMYTGVYTGMYTGAVTLVLVLHAFPRFSTLFLLSTASLFYRFPGLPHDSLFYRMFYLFCHRSHSFTPFTHRLRLFSFIPVSMHNWLRTTVPKSVVAMRARTKTCFTRARTKTCFFTQFYTFNTVVGKDAVKHGQYGHGAEE